MEHAGIIGSALPPYSSSFNEFEPRSVPTEFGIRAVSPKQWLDSRMLAELPYLSSFSVPAVAGTCGTGRVPLVYVVHIANSI